MPWGPPLAITLGLTAFGALAALALSGASASCDIGLMELAPSLHGGLGRALASLVAYGLGAFGLIPLTLLLCAWLFMRRRRLDALVLAVTMLSATALMVILKLTCARARPTLFPWLADASGFSFPSGHAFLNATFWLLFAALINQRWAWSVGVTMTLLVALMRVVAGVHWPTDVAAGMALGIALVGVALATRGRLTTATTAPNGRPATR